MLKECLIYVVFLIFISVVIFKRFYKFSSIKKKFYVKTIFRKGSFLYRLFSKNFLAIIIGIPFSLFLAVILETFWLTSGIYMKIYIVSSFFILLMLTFLFSKFLKTQINDEFLQISVTITVSVIYLIMSITLEYYFSLKFHPNVPFDLGAILDLIHDHFDLNCKYAKWFVRIIELTDYMQYSLFSLSNEDNREIIIGIYTYLFFMSTFFKYTALMLFHGYFINLILKEKK
ncbi:hypothetical protein [Caminibacter pacificus]